MRVHLLTITSLGLEVHRKGLTVHESIAGDDAHGRALSEDVQKRSLSSEHDQFGLIYSMYKEVRTFPAPDSPINAVNFPGTT